MYARDRPHATSFLSRTTDLRNSRRRPKPTEGGLETGTGVKLPGNANLPNGATQTANREIGVPGFLSLLREAGFSRGELIDFLEGN
jgi:hypothetical protein